MLSVSKGLRKILNTNALFVYITVKQKFHKWCEWNNPEVKLEWNPKFHYYYINWKDVAISGEFSEKLVNASDYMGSQMCFIVAAGIRKSAHLCKCLTDQDLIHGMMTWHVDKGWKNRRGQHKVGKLLQNQTI